MADEFFKNSCHKIDDYTQHFIIWKILIHILSFQQEILRSGTWTSNNYIHGGILLSTLILTFQFGVMFLRLNNEIATFKNN